MIKLFGPFMNMNFLVLLVSCYSMTAHAQEDALGSDVEEYENLEDSTLGDSAATPPEADASASSEVPSSDDAINEPTAQAAEGAAAPRQEAATSQAEQAAQQSDSSSEEAVPRESDSPRVVSEGPAKEVQTEVERTPSNDSDAKTVGTYGGRIFGRHKIQLAANRPTFNEGQKCYEKFYGKPETHISFSGEWFPLDWWINPGVYTRLGVYSVRGKAVSGSSDATAMSSCENLTVDENSSTSLLFMPIQVGAKIQFSPFRRKWLVLDYWTGAELDWWQETRNETASMLTASSLMASDQVYTTTGRKRSITVGASVHLLLNPLDERTVRSMIHTMGLGYVYLSGFMETVKSTSENGLNFGRKVLGIGFTFEAYK